MIIFSPGPSNISERVRRALLAPDICHRDEEFTELLAGVRADLLRVAGLGADDGYHAVVLGGSGSVGIEAVAAAARPLGPMLVVSNGPYGERAAAMGRHHGTEVREWTLPWGDEIDPALLDEQLAKSGAASLYLVHHETATGRLNDLERLAAVGKARGCMVLADTVSSIAGERVDVTGWRLDAIVGSANKCIRGVPGAAFVIASDAFLASAQRQRAAHYSNLAEHFAAEERGETPFTPPVHALFALREALRETLDETVEARIAHYRALMRLVQERLHGMGIRFLLDRAAYGSTLISCHLPEGHSYASLHRDLKAREYVIYAAQGALKARAFRLGLIGHFGLDEVTGFLDALERRLRA
ncbi:MAG: alanine--glyoxylate aminotransferase family protein [Gemmatimonadetes bacterium]|nr:alanine--glyoxylate aminotransferase family protein [Gemmatimonadota bacterium]